ncbi:SRPBCC domain-containing protein [Chitinophaga sp. HK235]|uniref:SRPBCC domain-containing protein n=1 Tax=Chitinophaga sp. HK235 TaxID=2952571 RepID=UPI001BAB757C|nr:SRPBCC domain-containing protein [Chitinophaga sp. HK235]
MEQKTKVNAEDGRLDLVITREFDLPVDLLFRAYVEADIVEQWMCTKVLKLESKKYGSWQIETPDAQGNVAMRANGVIHELIPDRKIIRTFEMENTPFGVQLEVYEFETLSDDTSKLTMHVIYESVAQRDQVLKMPFKQGINIAHKRLEEALHKLK